MVSSIALLLVLQFFWIQSSYRDAGEDFRKETNLIFRNTILSMHDSLIQRNLLPVGNDTFFTRKKRKADYFFDDTLRVVRSLSDSAFNIRITEKNARIEILSTNEKPDSISKYLRPIMRRIQRDGEPRNFIFRMLDDSLSFDSIQHYYAIALKEAGITATFKVTSMQPRGRKRAERTMIALEKSYTTDMVPFSPMNHYAASFPDVEGLLLKKISPQIAFSIFLTMLTIGSFYVMYRNLRSQQRLMQIKNDFISNVTHELKTPVATVSVALEAMKNFHALDNPQKTSEYLEIAQSELNRLTLMTDKILKTSVYEDQGVDLTLEIVDVDDLFQQVLSSMKLVFEKKNVRLVYSKVGTNFTVSGSREHLTNVFYNLIDNALKYGGDEPAITIVLEHEDDRVKVSIKDSGVGIHPDYHKKIFEKFFRVPSGDVHNIKGYGLGLSYVASVVRSHGGEINVESEPGKGSCFVISLPMEASIS
jgi:two-component system, OmpR family, phosphate regulon sensor histidine kinase PhoR